MAEKKAPDWNGPCVRHVSSESDTVPILGAICTVCEADDARSGSARDREREARRHRKVDGRPRPRLRFQARTARQRGETPHRTPLRGPGREFGPYDERGREPAEGLLGIPGTWQSQGPEEANRPLASARLSPRQYHWVSSFPAAISGTGLPGLVGRARPRQQRTSTQAMLGLRQVPCLPCRPDSSVVASRSGRSGGTAAMPIHKGEATIRHVYSRTWRSRDPRGVGSTPGTAVQFAGRIGGRPLAIRSTMVMRRNSRRRA